MNSYTIKLINTNFYLNIFDSDQVYDMSEYDRNEFADWLESFTEEQLDRIYHWVTTIPELRHELNFKCNHCQADNRRLLEGLHSFFRFGDA